MDVFILCIKFLIQGKTVYSTKRHLKYKIKFCVNFYFEVLFNGFEFHQAAPPKFQIAFFSIFFLLFYIIYSISGLSTYKH